MLGHMLLSYGLGAAYLWWLTAPLSPGASLSLGALLLAATALLFRLMWRRSVRMRSDHEGLAPRLVTHGGFGAGGSRWDRRRSDRDEPGDFEAHVYRGL